MQPYETTDFQLAVTLFTIGYQLAEVDSSNRRAIFRFDFEPSIENNASEFFKDKLLLNPRLVLTNTRLVKDRLYARQ